MLATAKTAPTKKSATASRSNATAVQTSLSRQENKSRNQKNQKKKENIAPITTVTDKAVKPSVTSSPVKPKTQTPKSQIKTASVTPLSSMQAKLAISRLSDAHKKQPKETVKTKPKAASINTKGQTTLIAEKAEVASEQTTIPARTRATSQPEGVSVDDAPANGKENEGDNKKSLDKKQTDKQGDSKKEVDKKKEGTKKADKKVDNKGTSEDNYPASPEDDPKFKTLKTRVKRTANQQQTTNPAEQESQAAQQAAPIAANERMGVAQESQVAAMDEQEPGEFDAAAFKAKLMERIKGMQLPANQDEATDFENNNNIQEINDAASREASQEQANTVGPITQATATPPNAEAVPEREVTPLPEPPIGASPTPVNANAAMPAPRPASQVSRPLQENMQEVDQQMADNEVTEAQLANANEPAFSSALGTRSEARAHTEAAPAQFRQQEMQSLNATRQQAENTSSEQLEGMHQGRAAILNSVLGQQNQSATQNTAERQRVSSEINTIYETTKADVEKILSDLDTEVTAKFDAAATKAKQKFEDYVAEKMDAYKDRRYSGLRGAARWVRDKFKSLPSEVNQFYIDGREVYISAMDAALTDISNHIALKLNAAKNRIEQGKKSVTTYVESLDDSLKSFGEQAAENIQTQFDELADSVNSKQDELIDSLAQQYSDSLVEVDARIEEMKAANRGLIDKAMDAINGVIETIRKLKELIASLLSAIQSVLSVIMADPIGFAKNLFAGVRRGFDSFVANIQKHLIGGFVKWLTGAIGSMGITIPDDLFSLKGIFSLVTQVLGLTWDYLRQKAVKLLGEPVVKAMEFGLEMFQIIRSKGFAGIWEYIKEQFVDLKEKIIDSIKDMLIVKVIQAGIKWLLGLLIPGAGFIKAAMAIKDFILFFVESALMLIPALITAIKALASGNVSMVTKAIEDGLVLLLPMVINLFAKLIGLGGLVKRVQKIIKRIRKRIDRAVNKLILKAKKAARGLLNRFKGNRQDTKPDTRTEQEKQKDVRDALRESNQVLDKNDISANQVKKELPAIKSKYRMKSVNLRQNSRNKKYYIEIINSPPYKTDEEDLKGRDPIDDYIGKTLFKNHNKDFSAEGTSVKNVIEGLGYEFRKQNEKYYIRRKNSEASKQVHINESGQLKEGAKIGSGQPEHSNYIPTKKTIKETANGYFVKYDTKTDQGEEGPNFHIDISYQDALESNPDKTETRIVTGRDLKLKRSRGARGKTDSAQQGFQNAHLIADRFGGSGRNRDLNIYPSSPRYNVKEMKDKEDAIASNLNETRRFNLSVTSTIKGEKADSSALKAAINEEAKRDNSLQVQKINEAMSNDLVGLVRKDIKGIPGKFISVEYKVDGKAAGNIGADSDYDNLIKKILKKK